MEGSSRNITVCCVLHRSVGVFDPMVESLRGQSRPPTEWIFCINGPDDGVRERLASMPEKPIVLERSENPGFASAVNACIENATGDLVLLLNPDVCLDSNYIAASLEVFRSERHVAAVGGRLRRADAEAGTENSVDTAGLVVEPWFRIVDRGVGLPADEAFPDREDVVGVCAAAAIFDRRALTAVAECGSVMDEDFFMYKEDQDLCLRLHEAGWRVLYEPAATGRHHRGWRYGERRSVPLRIRRHSLKNRYLILAKHWRWRRDWRRLPILLIFEIFLLTACLLREPRTMLGYLMAMRLMPRMMRKRRRLIAVERERSDGAYDPFATVSAA